MRGYRPGLWLLAAGLLGTLALWLATDVIKQLWAVEVLREYPRRYATAVGIVGFAFTAILIAGAVVARAGSEGPRRWWLTGVAAELAVYQLLLLVPWLASLAGTEVGLDTFVWCVRIAMVMHLVALATLALVARQEQALRTLATVALCVLGAQTMLYLIRQLATNGVHRLAYPTSVVDTLASTVSLLITIGLVFGLLGAFPVEGSAPQAQARNRAHSVATASAIALMFVSVAFAALAVWGTKRVSSLESTASTLVVGTVVFMGAAVALVRLQRREVPLVKFGIATFLVLGLGRVALGAYVGRVEQVELETHQLPGVSLGLPEGDTDIEYQYAELGKVTVSPRHSDLGLVEVSWSQRDDDPIVEYSKISGVDKTPITGRARELEVNGVVWSMSNVVQLFASWQCPNDGRWFVLSISRYATGVDVVHDIADRVFETIRCTGRTSAPPFVLPAPADFTSVWARNLAPDEVMARVHIDPDKAEVSRVTAKPIPHGIIEDDDRTVYEQHDDAFYRIAAVWHCYTLDIDVAVFTMAPPTRPRESLLAAIRSAHCPR